MILTGLPAMIEKSQMLGWLLLETAGGVTMSVGWGLACTGQKGDEQTWKNFIWKNRVVFLEVLVLSVLSWSAIKNHITGKTVYGLIAAVLFATAVGMPAVADSIQRKKGGKT